MYSEKVSYITGGKRVSWEVKDLKGVRSRGMSTTIKKREQKNATKGDNIGRGKKGEGSDGRFRRTYPQGHINLGRGPVKGKGELGGGNSSKL